MPIDLKVGVREAFAAQFAPPEPVRKNKRAPAVHVMVDLETLGTAPGSVVTSIGAVSTDRGHEPFYGKISITSSLHAGLVADPDTLSWWRKQPLHTWAAATEGDVSLAMQLGSFAVWLANLRKGSDDSPTGAKVLVWGDSAAFDLGLLACAYRAVNMPVPWHYTEERCYRTLRSELDSEKPRSKVQHDALSDANAQLVHLVELLAKLEGVA